MSLHDKYKHLIGLPYVSGRDDCYGLARCYYKDVFGVNLTNFARPEGWWNHQDMDLINWSVSCDGWEKIGTNTKALKIGDGLVFSLIHGKANHVGCYVGNGMFIHHVYKRFSNEEALLEKWTSRLLMIIRHPEVSKKIDGLESKTDLMSILPEHVRARLIRPPSA